MTKVEAIIDSIAHWERMISWVKQQNPLEQINPYIMKDKLGELWDEENCALCKYSTDEKGKVNCAMCPLAKNLVYCNTPDSLWTKIHFSSNWSEWVENAEEMLAILKELFAKEIAIEASPQKI